MVTGASSANLSVVLVDARNGVIQQSRRHTCLAALLGIPHLVIAVNKMDLVSWSEERFLEIRDAFEAFLPRLDVFKDVKFIPISALNGDNVVEPSQRTPWYEGPTLLGHLETVPVGDEAQTSLAREQHNSHQRRGNLQHEPSGQRGSEPDTATQCGDNEHAERQHWPGKADGIVRSQSSETLQDAASARGKQHRRQPEEGHTKCRHWCTVQVAAGQGRREECEYRNGDQGRQQRH